jgi:hypothetical protein
VQESDCIYYGALRMGILQSIAIIVGVVTGVSGLVLGILNCLHQWRTARPRVVVRPRVWNVYDEATGQTSADVGIMEISNIGQMPVAGSIIGFMFRGRKGCFFIPKPESIGGAEWRQELKPQHCAMLRFKLRGPPGDHKLGRAFFRTIVGDTFKASRRDMREFARQRKAALSGSPGV